MPQTGKNMPQTGKKCAVEEKKRGKSESVWFTAKATRYCTVSPQTTRIYTVTQINVRICVVTITTHCIYGVTTL